MALAQVGNWTTATFFNSTGGTTATRNVAAGNFIALNLTSGVNTATLTASTGDAITIVEGPVQALDYTWLRIVENTTASATYSFTVTVAAGSFTIIAATEYSGVLTSSSLDKHTNSGQQAGNGTVSSGTTAATTQADELLVFVGNGDTPNNSTWTLSGGYNLRGNTGNGAVGNTGFLADLIVAATGAQSATATFGATVNARAGMIGTFKAAPPPFTHTDRGDTQTTPGTSATNTVASASFTPAVGSLITVSVAGFFDDGGAGATTYSITNTGFTVDAWTQKGTAVQSDGGTASVRVAEFYGIVTASAAGVITCTRTAGNIQQWMLIQVDEWFSAAVAVGQFASALDGRVSATTLTATFGAPVATTSGVAGIVFDNNGASGGAVQPTGWTESADTAAVATGGSIEAAWKLGSVSAANQWTALQANTFGKVACAIEILQAPAGYTGTGTRKLESGAQRSLESGSARVLEAGAGVTGTNLTVQNATHAHTAANVVLTQVHNITVAGATHAHTAGNVAISKNLVVANATHSQTAGAPTLVASPAVQNATHAHTAQNVAISKNLVVANATHAHTAANVALGIPLLVASATHAHTAGAPVLVASPAVQSATHAHTATTVALIVNLAVNNATHAHTAQNVPLGIPLTVQSASHGHTAGSPALVKNLAVQNASHGHTATTVALIVNLVVANSSHSHTATNVALSKNLVVQGATHAHSATTVALGVPLIVANATHAHTAQNVVLVKNLAVQNATHGHVATNVAVGVPLIVASATHSHTAQNVALGVGGSVASSIHAVTSTNVALGIPLIVASATHAHVAGSVTLVLPVNLVVQSATHGHVATSPPLGVTLVVASASHGHTVTNVVLGLPSGMVVHDATHGHTAANVPITSVHTLAIQSGLHGHSADVITLTTVAVLLVASAIHAHLATQPTIGLGPTPLTNIFYLDLDTGDVYQRHTGGDWDLQGRIPEWVPVP